MTVTAIPRLYSSSLDEGKEKDLFNITASIVLPILFTLSAILTIYFNFLHPVPLAFIVCAASTACSVTLLIGALSYAQELGRSFHRTGVRQIAATEKVQQIIRNTLHLGRRKEGGGAIEQIRERTRAALGIYPDSEIVEYESQDGRALQSIWVPSNLAESRHTVILFHGNGFCADHQLATPLFNYYRAKGFNLLLVEYRGYGICEGVAATAHQEIHAYYDAHAAFNYLRNQRSIDPENMLVHGYSLGGAYAASLAHKVRAVVLDHTFTSFPAVASYVSMLDMQTTTFVCQKAFPYSRDENFETDLFDNVRKIRNMQGALLVIRGEEDEIMKFEFGEELIQARYSDREMQEKRLLTTSGGHLSRDYVLSEEYRLVSDQFLEESFNTSFP